MTISNQIQIISHDHILLYSHQITRNDQMWFKSNHVNAEINMEYINHFFKNCDYKLIIKYAKQSFTV